MTIGLHGMKRRWAADTVRDGLRRPSAAWFMLPAEHWTGIDLATAAAAVYLGLGRSARRQLCAADPGVSYAQVFDEHPDLLPSLMFFADAPTGHEVTHRYAWRGGAGLALTAVYTKVARAGRMTGAPPSAVHVETLRANDVAGIEDELSRAGQPSWLDDPGLVERVECDAQLDPALTRRAPSRIGAFCEVVAGVLLGRLASATREVRA